MLAKKSDSESTILEDSAVLAQLISVSLPSVSVLMARCSSMNLHACKRHNRTQVAAVLGKFHMAAQACLYHSIGCSTTDNCHSTLATKLLLCCQ